MDSNTAGARIHPHPSENLYIPHATLARKTSEALNWLKSTFKPRCCGKERSACVEFLCPCGADKARTLPEVESPDEVPLECRRGGAGMTPKTTLCSPRRGDGRLHLRRAKNHLLAQLATWR